MTDNIMSTTETTENQGLRLIVDNAMPRQFDDTVVTDCQHTATETRHTATDETLLPPYTGKKIQDSLGISERTFYRYLAEIKEAWFWIPEANFRDGKGYSLLTLDQMKLRNSLSSKDEYVALIHGENAKAIAVWKAPLQEQLQPIEAEIEDDLGLDCGILARYEKKPQEDQQSSQVVPYFNPSDYQSRYTSSEQRLKNQQQKEIGFANELLTKFADFAEDDAAWKQSEAQNSEARQREMAIAGMSEALGDFLQKNTAYRSMMERLEAGEITPERVMEFLKRMQSQKSPVGNGSSASS